jgi:hypothetical protein
MAIESGGKHPCALPAIILPPPLSDVVIEPVRSHSERVLQGLAVASSARVFAKQADLTAILIVDADFIQNTKISWDSNA